jgi:prepilin-type processing-associated H-X9-DG protein
VEPETWLRDAVPYVNVLLVDGSVRQLPVDTQPEVVKALLTIDGGETFDPPWLK